MTIILHNPYLSSIYAYLFVYFLGIFFDFLSYYVILPPWAGILSMEVISMPIVTTHHDVYSKKSVPGLSANIRIHLTLADLCKGSENSLACYDIVSRVRPCLYSFFIKPQLFFKFLGTDKFPSAWREFQLFLTQEASSQYNEHWLMYFEWDRKSNQWKLLGQQYSKTRYGTKAKHLKIDFTLTKSKVA